MLAIILLYWLPTSPNSIEYVSLAIYLHYKITYISLCVKGGHPFIESD